MGRNFPVGKASFDSTLWADYPYTPRGPRISGQRIRVKHFLATLLCLTGCWLGGCTTGSTDAPDAFAGLAWPDQFGGSNTNTPAGTGWLTDFNDNTLNALVHEALTNNPDLRVTAAKLKAAEAGLGVAAADRLPTLSARAAASRVKRNRTSGFQITSSRTERYTPSLELNWELDVWNRLQETQRAAHRDTQQAAANLQAARLSLAANTAKGWFDVAETELQVQLARQSHASYTNNLAVLEEGLQRGLTKALDVRLMRTSVRNAENTLQLRLRERDAARRALEVLLGRYPKSEIALSAGLPTLTNAVPAGLPAQLIERRPDIRAAQLGYLAAHHRVNAAEKDRLPKISLSASAGTSSQELQDVLDVNNNIWNLAANLTQPIFDAGKLRYQAERNRALREQARYQYVQTTLQAFAEVETALGAETYLTRQESALRASANEANEAQTLAQDDYLAGLTDIVTVLESQRRVFDARRSLLEIQNLRLQNRIDLYLAIGGEFAPPAPPNE